jgi:8-oxo-dGTP diphosphatase
MVEVVAAIIEKDGLIYCFKKGKVKFDYLSYKFEFPGGKVELDEDHSSALKREIEEELSTQIAVESHVLSAEHTYPDFSIRLHFYKCKLLSTIGLLTEHTEYRTLPISKLKTIEWLPADVPAVEYLIDNA